MIKIIHSYEEIENIGELLNLISEQMQVIGGNPDHMFLKNALINALKPDSNAVLFIEYDSKGRYRGFAFGNKSCGLQSGGDYFWLNELFISPLYRCQGLASELLKYIDSWCKVQNMKYVLGSTSENNHEAQKLYEKNGFELDSVIWISKTI